MASARVKRAPRKKPKNLGYKPAGEPEGYTPALKTRKAPHAYWCRNPYPDGFGKPNGGKPQPLPRKKVAWDDLDDFFPFPFPRS